MANCPKEYAWMLANKFWLHEWTKIKPIEFPSVREYEITEDICTKEITNLIKKDNHKTFSDTIIKFHKSLIYANKKSKPSPYDYWQKLKENPLLFKKFYENRLLHSDWYKTHPEYLKTGFMPEFIYGIGLNTSRKAPFVSYFKPSLAKRIIKEYLNDYHTIFDPCSGYSGRMIGALCANKNYIGYDINKTTINESQELYNSIKNLFPEKSCLLQHKDSLNTEGEFDCMFTCTPYNNLEEWKDDDTLISSNMSCDEWIDKLINNYKCKKYVFVTDNKIFDYKSYIADTIKNSSHFGNNFEYIVVINKA